MVDEHGFKVSLKKKEQTLIGGVGFLKLSVLIEAYLQPCICDELGHVSTRTIVKEVQVRAQMEPMQ